ncbi:MAG TPA: tail fiber domain-containing protein [Candidatus Udaeobacter sp.]|nr:tail fiber domain-containing protein [Candidatus Udaeobacter sp.]
MTIKRVILLVVLFSALFAGCGRTFKTAIREWVLMRYTHGKFNTANGSQALHQNTYGESNTADGYQALYANTHGKFNTASGSQALHQNTYGESNTAVGSFALYSNTTGQANTAYGMGALDSNTTGYYNTAIGEGVLAGNITGSWNVGLGAFAGSAVTTANHVIVIGAQVDGANVSNTCFIGNIRGVTTINNNGLPVVVDSAGQLGTASSSARFKKEIKPMDKASEVILALKPVTFYYKSDKTNRPEFGLIAEEVAEVNPDLAVHDESGEIYTVRYDAVNAMLLNEFLKEHRKVQELEANAAKQQKQIEALTAGLQKVSAELELSKAVPQTILNNQ